MKAVVSGRACVALLIRGDELHSIHYDNTDELVLRHPEDFRTLFGGANDLDFLEEVDSIDGLRSHLEDAVDETEALDLLLFLCDEQLSQKTRESAAIELEELIVYPEIVASLEQILFAQPLPSSVHFDGARSACAATNSRKTQHFLEQLFQSQPAIEVVRSSWDQFPEDSFAGKSRQQVEAICLRKGLFADFVREFRDTAQVANSQMRWSADGELRKQLPTVVNLLNQWAKRIGGNTSQHQPAAQDQYPETDNHEVDTQKPQKTHAARS
ncbi:MAG: hypothetical protein DWI02_10415 [Planctomycetota bacterium]|nr:MAG: hypothetical protein DWI02_10415 [Planctomycetota bacterium]